MNKRNICFSILITVFSLMAVIMMFLPYFRIGTTEVKQAFDTTFDGIAQLDSAFEDGGSGGLLPSRSGVKLLKDVIDIPTDQTYNYISGLKRLVVSMLLVAWITAVAVIVIAWVLKKKAKYTSKDMAEIKDVLGTYTTEYGGSPYGRKVNVANGASKINGSMVYPGETLSVYKTVSPFTKENGYALAGSYENGQTVQTYGGGICQVSTTLYNAVIRAELKIVERFPHSMTVHYVPRSADAAIAGTHKDMKFKNTFDTPIYIEGKANGSTITFTVYGKKKDPKRTVEFLSETTQVKESSESTVSDNTLAEGQKVLESYGHTGYSARLWKIVKINGKQVSKKVFNTSTYMSTPTVYRVGTKKAEDKKDDKKDKKKDSKETTAQKSETTTAAQKSTTAAQKSTTAKRSAAVKSQGSTGN